jgi:5-methylcytosine-specific restriction endonuclease McrA
VYKRDWHEPAYAKWREEVRRRDGGACQWPGCKCRNKRKLEIHHIKKWSDHPSSRYALANGITLCKDCHKKIKGSEENYEEFFYKILEWQMLNKIKRYNE